MNKLLQRLRDMLIVFLFFSPAPFLGVVMVIAVFTFRAGVEDINLTSDFSLGFVLGLLPMIALFSVLYYFSIRVRNYFSSHFILIFVGLIILYAFGLFYCLMLTGFDWGYFYGSD